MQLGCHAVLFKEAIKTNTQEVISKLKAAGFDGGEIGSRFFGTENKKDLLDVLEANDFQMSAMHAVTFWDKWEDEEEAKNQFDNILKVAEFVKDLPSKNIMLSGVFSVKSTEILDYLGSFPDEKIVAAAKKINEVALACRKLGVSLNYHNHNWEFAGQATLYHALVLHAPDLNFGFDLGWAQKAGADPIQLLKEHGDRINYVHIRDLSKDGDFVDLGQGMTLFKELIPAIKETLGQDGWMVVEYETGEEDFGRYERAFDFLQQFI